MLEAREEVEHEILWMLNKGSTNIWHKNWTGIGALYHVLPHDFNINEEIQEIAELRDGNDWDEQLLTQKFPESIADHIRDEFSVNSAWRILRHRAPINPEFSNLWTKGLPFKISFFAWRLWKRKIPTDDLWRRNGYIIVSKYWCCFPPNEESFQHLFLMNETADRMWKHFLQPAGTLINMVQVHQVIRAWWNEPCCKKLKPLFQAAPTVITWKLWKRRNTIKNGGTIYAQRVIHEVNKTLHFLARIRYPWLSNIPGLWPNMIRFFESYKLLLVSRRVTWELPLEGWFKCNTDGASKGNPGPSSYGFGVRDSAGDLIHVEATEIGEATNLVEEAKGLMNGLLYCVKSSFIY
ncbi:uncharacterized protein [Nicotiana tomentosiformis]|uniref:uncharacterized protein n=1 Tax=Nicotiana tomentosiformis TaxID=4098 RepID=UPI00051BEC59|nr:uncharacterized protein LOC104120240 [Nicotiana tomentosiformis]